MATKIGSQIAVDRNNHQTESDPVTTALAGGGYVVLWKPNNPSNSSLDAQIIDASGNFVGAEFEVNQDTQTPQIQSYSQRWDITSHPNGGFIFAFDRFLHTHFVFGDTTTYSVLTYQYTPGSGTSVGPFTGGENGVVLASRGNIIVEAANNTAANNNVYIQVLNTTTSQVTSFTSPYSVTTPPSDVAVLSNGDIVLVGGEGSPFNAFGTIFHQDGSVVASKFAVNSSAIWGFDAIHIATIANGNFVAVYESVAGATPDDTDGIGVRGRLFAPDGTALGADFAVNTLTAGDQHDANVIGLPNGGFVVAWENGNYVDAQIFDAAGNKDGTEFVVNTTPSFVDDVSLVDLGSGRFAVTWTERPDGNSIANSHVYSQVFDLNLGSNAYFVDASSAPVVEYVNGGNDAVYSSVNYILPANVENLYLQGSATNGYGNADANYMAGTALDNLLDGQGGPDLMAGGAGNDSYFIDTGPNAIYLTDGPFAPGANPGDLIAENPGEGHDSVYSSITFTLPANVEDIYLTGSGDVSAYGNTQDNVIGGNAGNNVLYGGAGADTMAGGAGSDAYFVDNAGDVVIEQPGAGGDAVYSSVNYVLPANVENLYLLGSATNAYGNAGANYIQGTGHTDLIQGKGGGDALAGMAGGDYFVFSPGEADEAIVLDFSGTGGEGDLLLFTGFAPGTTFTAVDATHWQLSYGTTVEVIGFANAATITPSDFLFM